MVDDLNLVFEMKKIKGMTREVCTPHLLINDYFYNRDHGDNSINKSIGLENLSGKES